ncbi:WecB/TagA/CpsF family glycosyltransferase [Paenibacillus sp. NPDC056579]|uniref:WecB/TagA/CpsF family glycosyltransferase n=1 Tax=unclassified Paenibacillus TaxID=185978 RepID=UPI001EF9A84C|nr:WecB/TagA/CpsF family glycosyltransferase [Paenibacillus sp. H1-7]ULL18032.1 glycosyltransferase [Paenibacillus sp. H1-7]
MQQSIDVMGVSFSTLNLTETLEHLTAQADRKEGEGELFHLITANPEIVMTSRQDAQLKQIMDAAGLVTPDGIGIVMAAKWKGTPLRERVTGFDILTGMLEIGSRKGYSFYFLGADEETSRKSVETIMARYPGVRIAGRQNGFFDKKDEDRIVREIGSAKPDFLIVAMGAPYSEKWINKYRTVLNAKITFGVGGSLDVIAGKVKRAPVVWQKLHVEWLYRLLSNPSRWRRQLVLPKFAWKVITGKA